ncbi:hypothetical protein E4T52_09550 [Aureobasidium sp. EXF-3400]|nr:hypothetical protein E4T51_08697 [Aureobasidium sp. EXF-12344]KAI4775512.1 hypothetical protein E4T52_09550 [Aureobasidium sp. EXF-3400]
MSSPSLPSLSSLQPMPRPQGSILADFESQDNYRTEPSDVTAPPEKPKRGRPKKAVDADDAPAKPRPRKKVTTTTDANLDAGDVDKPPTKVATRKRQAATTNEQEAAIDAPPAAKRGRPKKAVAIEDDATAITDTTKISKPAVKRPRKKAFESADTLDNDAAAAKPKPPPKPRKTKAPSKAMSVANDPIAASEVPIVDAPEVTDTGVQPLPQAEAPVEVLDLDPAPSRRRDWTPPTESALPPSFQQSSDSSPLSEPPTHGPEDNDVAGDAPTTLDFTRLMGDFGYQEDHPRPPPTLSRTPSDGPTTKRKRLEPVDVSAADEPKKRKRKAVEPKEPKQPKEPKEPKPKPPKKPKAPKKKPLTITALATAAYLPQPAVTDEDQTKLISDFFPQPQTGAVDMSTGEVASAKPTGSTKAGPTENKPAPKRKRAVKKVQITVPEVHIKLDSPEAARENAKRQQWLFGSSSQLAAAESPTELRDLQQALKESEDMISSQQMDISRATSCTHVPSAPHGTSLSIGQGDRVLWMSAARDFEDSTFASDESRDNDDSGLPNAELQKAQHLSSTTQPTLETHLIEAKPEIEVLTISSSAPKELESPDSGYVDVDQIARSSPQTTLVPERLETDGPTAAAVVPARPDIISLDTTPETEAAPRRALGTRDPNTKITKQTLDSENKKLGISPRKTIAGPHVICLDSPEKRSTGLLRDITDIAVPTRSPVVLRRIVGDSPALSAREGARQRFLDSPALSAREEARKRHDAASPIRDALRPSQARLHDIVRSPILISPPKAKTKPLKSGPVASPASCPRRKSMSPDDLPIISPPKPRGRPSKFGPAPNPASPARPRGRARRPSIAEPPSDYLDIDAISDVETTANVPSPPRRLPTTPPKATLDFDVPPPPPLPAIATSTARCSAKQLLAEFPSIAPTLFPKITSTVRSIPPSRDHKAPTWYEKILLYDPIVLEDLTLWLNSQGVRLEISVARPVKGKGKKKADEVDDGESVMDLVQEELQPWMVQKWCEEHSICCLWKEGLRGGVRQKY